MLIYFAQDIGRIVVAWFALAVRPRAPRRPRRPDGLAIIVGTIPIVVLGLLFQDQIETTCRDLWLIAIALIVFSLILLVRRPRCGAQGPRARATSPSGTASSSASRRRSR